MGEKQEQADSGAAEVLQYGHYRLLHELGRGAQGVVYLAEDTNLHRKVALKVLLGGRAQLRTVRERFQREAELASKLDHPGICSVHEVGEDGGMPFIAMQYVRGTTLAEMLEAARARSADEDGAEEGQSAPAAEMSSTSLTGKDAVQDILPLLENAARSLHAAHEAGLVHRDVKPGNIMITPEGQPVLLDFGLARDFEGGGHTITESGSLVGTPAYMAPEQFQDDRDAIDRQTDVYALGVTLYECLTLRRPFESEALSTLYHLILEGTPSNPRRLNPRIPPDLVTVIETAMERDRGRRYATALDFAEDLRRVRAFEPIRAKAAGPVLRARKWARRHPGRAVGIAAALVFTIAGAGFLVGQDIALRNAVRGYLGKAEELASQGDFPGALEAIAHARERDPESARALALRASVEKLRDAAELEAQRRSDLDAAASARSEAARKQDAYAEARGALLALEDEVRRERGPAFSSYAPLAVRGAFARKEKELERQRLAAERLLQESREALERAARLEARWGETPETRAAFASYFLGRWREAVETGDSARAALFRSAVVRYDPQGKHEAELQGLGRLSLVVEPADASLHLFRYESHERVRPGNPIPRLVPVPTRGIGRSREGPWLEDFYPGDACLLIHQVEAGSPAEAAGLRRGDLILRVNGQPAGDGLFLLSTVGLEGSLEAEGHTLARIDTLNGVAIEGRFDWAMAPRGDDRDRLRLVGAAEELACDRASLAVARPEDVARDGAPSGEFHLLCLRDGEALNLQIPSGERPGIHAEPTAYPLICSDENRIRAGSTVSVDPGSYLVLARREGFEDQRYPVVVPRQEGVHATLELLGSGQAPPGFVYVPPGTFLYGGDADAVEPVPEEEVALPGFFIGRREVTNEEWFAFVNDPEIQDRIAASEQPLYLPREIGAGVMPRQNLGGPGAPVMGVSWNDVRDYLGWRNARAEAAGEPWIYDLPTQQEWEKAARGVDGRAFPWGDRFDFSVVVGLYRKPRHLYDAPSGFEPRDESPYGILDAGGHRQEWSRDPYTADPDAPPIYRWRGGCWRFSREQLFRSASRGYGEADYVGGNIGFRLVARQRS